VDRQCQRQQAATGSFTRVLRPFKPKTRFGKARAGEAGRGRRSLLQLTRAHRAAVSRNLDLPVSIPGRSATEVFRRLISIRALYAHGETLHLREVSSRTFWGLSKIFDNRSDLVAALLGLAECPYPAQPIHLNIYLAGPRSWILFVENKTSFERAIRDAGEALLHGRFSPHAGAALIYSSGFMGTAGRMRKSTGSRNRRYARTASYAQVTEKLYDRSRFRYRPYARHLAPVIPILEPVMLRLGYGIESLVKGGRRSLCLQCRQKRNVPDPMPLGANRRISAVERPERARREHAHEQEA
jgi:hypothetical protein